MKFITKYIPVIITTVISTLAFAKSNFIRFEMVKVIKASSHTAKENDMAS